jgi:acyl carrier protein
MMASYEEALSAASEIIARHMPKPRAVLPSDHILSDLGLDSLGVMEVVADIEERFEIVLPNEILTRLETVEDVAKALTKLSA